MSGRAAALRTIYAQVPTIPGCTGECWDSCTIVPMHELERERLASVAGARDMQVRGVDLVCGYLTPDNRCAAYAVRPLICRLFGAVDEPNLRCEHCQIERPLTQARAMLLEAMMYEVGGELVSNVGTLAEAEWLRDFMLAEPEQRQAMRRATVRGAVEDGHA